MSKKNTYSFKSKSTNWGKVFRRTVSDVTENIFKYKSSTTPIVPICCNPGARLCIYVLIILTLLFSGIGIYSWIILGMLLLILKFV